MKKVLSKIMAIALTAVMTACLTSCEDQRDIPVYGTGLEDDTGVHHQIVTEPRYEEFQVMGADFMLINAVIEQGTDGYEYLVLYTGVTNMMSDKHSADELIGVSAKDPEDTGLYYMRDSIGDYNPNDQEEPIDPGKQKLILYAYRLPVTETEYVVIRVHDHFKEEFIFETNIYLETK